MDPFFFFSLFASLAYFMFWSCFCQDKHEWVIERILKLAKAGMVNALVALSSTESKNSRECLCRIFMAMATVDSLRGLLVQQGAVKVSCGCCCCNTGLRQVWTRAYMVQHRAVWAWVCSYDHSHPVSVMNMKSLRIDLLSSLHITTCDWNPTIL